MEEIRCLFDIPYYQQKHYPKSDAFGAKINGEWVTQSIDEFLADANKVSKGLRKLGIGPNDKVAIIANNRPEWNIMDIGILQIGAIGVPIYPTISEADYKFIFNDAEVKLCVVSDEELLGKVKAIEGEVPTLNGVYTFDDIPGATSWKEILKLGEEGDQAEVDQLKSQCDPDGLATLIYTSGTTGLPKGVMLSHNNIISNCIASIERLPVDHHAKALSFLPLCHIYERMLVYLYILTGVSVYYAESMDTIGDNLREVQPDVFTAVPRLLEKVYDKIVAKGAMLSGIKKKLFFWALELGLKYEPYGANGGWYEFRLKIARKLIFSKWQEALGGRVKVVASGSAALQPRLARVFNAAAIPIMEGYGLTETSPVVSVNCEDNRGLRFGTVGRALKDVEVKIANDGEILVKGPNLMMGYYKRDDLTKEVIDEDGWFHTGDIGELQDGEYLRITDRKKEIFKTSGGKYIAPQVMENKFKESRFIEQVMVIGEYQKFPAAMVVPSFEFLKEYCEGKGIEYGSNEAIIKNQRIIDRIQKEIDQFNEGFGSWEQIKQFELLPEEWSIDGGELTPTLKLRRKKILEKYQHVHDKIYNQ